MPQRSTTATMMTNELDPELSALANDGDPYAQNSLASCYALRGEDGDRVVALRWYLRAVKQGLIEAMWNSGTMFLNGEGVPANTEVGLRLINIAAEHGDNSACLFMAHCYETGMVGFRQDARLASTWKEKAWRGDSVIDFVSDLELIREVSEVVDVYFDSCASS